MTHPWQVTTRLQYGHCSYCGAEYPENAPWPRVCVGCGETTWRNPLPVAVMLMPVRYADRGPDGLVVVRRDIEPARGDLCLPGGFIDFGETWAEGAVRELREETGLRADPAEVTLFDVVSTPRHVMVFGIVPPRDAGRLPASAPTEEATEWLVLREPRTLAFPSHTGMMRHYFASA
jgi:8-oxo-dGTP diphosphatase